MVLLKGAERAACRPLLRLTKLADKNPATCLQEEITALKFDHTCQYPRKEPSQNINQSIIKKCQEVTSNISNLEIP